MEIHLKYIYGMIVFTKVKNVHWHTKHYGECMRIDKFFVFFLNMNPKEMKLSIMTNTDAALTIVLVVVVVVREYL